MTSAHSAEGRMKGWLAVAKDVLNVLHLPGGETLGAALEQALERRRREALEILLQELENGQRSGISLTDEDVPEFAEMVLRFGAAASKGAARQNLRLLAQVIVGLKRNRSLEFDQFQKWANALETLTRDEIIILAAGYGILKEGPTDETFWKRLKDRVSTQFSEPEIAQFAAGLTRTGLLTPASGWGELVYEGSPSLAELGELAELELRDHEKGRS